MSKVKSLHGFATKEGLIDLAQDPDIEQVMVVCIYRDGSVDSGWTRNITHSQLIFGSAVLNDHINRRVFPHRIHADDIIY